MSLAQGSGEQFESIGEAPDLAPAGCVIRLRQR